MEPAFYLPVITILAGLVGALLTYRSSAKGANLDILQASLAEMRIRMDEADRRTEKCELERAEDRRRIDALEATNADLRELLGMTHRGD